MAKAGVSVQARYTQLLRGVRSAVFLVLAGGPLCAVVGVAQDSAVRSQQDAVSNSLSGNTVLLIRHAEKPDSGAGLTPAGERRAQAYVTYFESFHEGAEHFRVDALYSGADSANSNRPRLTLEPLSRAAHLPINDTVSTKDPAALVTLLRSSQHGAHPLVCWRHGQIPALLQAFGADPATLLPGGKWPDEVFDWVLVLDFDAAGKLASAVRLQEHITLP